jgi:hypothetical protein
VPALKMLLAAYGFETESMYDWKSRLAGLDTSELRGYAQGNRVTLRCRSREAALAAGWEPTPLAPVAPAPPGARARKPTPTPAQAPPAAGWRERVNATLAKVTGYELRRVASTGDH